MFWKYTLEIQHANSPLLNFRGLLAGVGWWNLPKFLNGVFLYVKLLQKWNLVKYNGEWNLSKNGICCKKENATFMDKNNRQMRWEFN